MAMPNTTFMPHTHNAHTCHTQCTHDHLSQFRLLVVASLAPPATGDGRNLLLATGALGFASAIGMENNPLLVWAGRLRARWAGRADRITIDRDDFVDATLPQPEPPIVVYLYLSRDTISALAPRLVCAYGSTKRTLVLSRDFEMPDGWGAPDHHLERGRTVLRAYRVPPPRRHLCAGEGQAG